MAIGLVGTSPHRPAILALQPLRSAFAHSFPVAKPPAGLTTYIRFSMSVSAICHSRAVVCLFPQFRRFALALGQGAAARRYAGRCRARSVASPVHACGALSERSFWAGLDFMFVPGLAFLQVD